MEPTTMQVEEVQLPEDYKMVEEENAEFYECCGICGDCCFTESTGGN